MHSYRSITIIVLSILLSVWFHSSANGADLETWGGNIQSGELTFKRGSFSVSNNNVVQNILLDEVFEVRFAEEAKDVNGSQRVTLTDGSKFNASVGVSSDFSKIPITLANGITLNIDGQYIQSIEFQNLDSGAKVIGTPPGPHCISRNGKTVLCDIEWISNIDISIKTKAGRIKLERDKIHLIGFARPELKPTNKTDIRLRTRFNDSIIGKLVIIDDETIQLDHKIGRLTFKKSNIYSIEQISDQTVGLASLNPIKTEQTPYLDYIKNIQFNTNLLGGPLVLDGVRYDNGISMHSKSLLTYNLNGAFKKFIVNVGLDNSTTDQGNVDFVIIANAKEVKRINISGTSKSQLIHLDVSGVTTLSIIVDFAKNGSSGDHAIWGNPRLLK